MTVSVGRLIRRAHWITTQLGIDPLRTVNAIRSLPRFVGDYMRFRATFDGDMALMPCLHERSGEAGEIRHEYFWQDLIVAQRIFRANPRKHVDVGSRIDGFVAHVASFRPVEILDIRPLGVRIPNVTFRQADIVNLPDDLVGYCDSLSCLHALEHVGLGRYGDRLDPHGPQRAFANLCRILAPGGLYLSVPCGRPRVEFNAHRVFAFETIGEWAREHDLAILEVAVIGPDGVGCRSSDPAEVAAFINGVPDRLCLFEMRKAESER